MVFFTSYIINELDELPLVDKQKIIQSLHWAISEDDDKVEIALNYFRDGESLMVYKVDYRDLYEAIGGRF
jgi:hypothetical protein